MHHYHIGYKIARTKGDYSMLNWIKTLLGSQPNHAPVNVQQTVLTDVVDLTGPGLFLLEVVGESHYQEALESIAGGPNTGP